MHLLCSGTYCYPKPFSEQLFKAMVRTGTDVELRHLSGQTPLFTLVQSRTLKVKISRKSFEPTLRGPESICEAFLQAGARLDVIDRKGRSLLHAAVSNSVCDCCTFPSISGG